MNVVHLNSLSVYYSQILDKILGGPDVMFFPVQNENHSTLKSIVQSEFRERNNQITVTDRIDAAFTIIRKFSAVWREYQSFGIEFDPSEEDADDSLSSCSSDYADSTTSVETLHSSSSPQSVEDENKAEQEDFLEAHSFMKDTPVLRGNNGIVPGMLLVAHPMVQGALRQAVVLILYNSPDLTYGIVINKPTEFSFAESAIGLPEDVLAPFKDSNINFGGLIRRLNCLHPYAQCGGNPVPLCSNDDHALYWSADIDKLKDFADKNPEMKDNVRFFAG